MARPKSEDPKVALTIRLPASVLARLGPTPRATLEDLILARDARLLAPKPPKVEAPILQRAAPAYGSRLKKR